MLLTVLVLVSCGGCGWFHRQKEILSILRSSGPGHRPSEGDNRPDTAVSTAASIVQTADGEPAIKDDGACSNNTAIAVHSLRIGGRQASAPDLGRNAQGSLTLETNPEGNGAVGTQQPSVIVSGSGSAADSQGRRPRSARLLLPDWGPQPSRRRDQAGARRVQARSWSMSDASLGANLGSTSDAGIREHNVRVAGDTKIGEKPVSSGNCVGNDQGFSILVACPPMSPKRQESQPSAPQQMTSTDTVSCSDPAATQQPIFQEEHRIVAAPHKPQTVDKRQSLSAQPADAFAVSVAAPAVLQGQVGVSADLTVQPLSLPVATQQNSALQGSALRSEIASHNEEIVTGTHTRSNVPVAEGSSITVNNCIPIKVTGPVRRHSAILSRPPSHPPGFVPEGHNAVSREEVAARVVAEPRVIGHSLKSDEPVRAVRGAVRPVSLGISSRNGSFSQLTPAQEVANAAHRFRGALEAAAKGIPVADKGGNSGQHQTRRPKPEQEKVAHDETNDDRGLLERGISKNGAARAEGLGVGASSVTWGEISPPPAVPWNYSSPSKVRFGSFQRAIQKRKNLPCLVGSHL